MTLTLQRGDLVRQHVDAIVNAANPAMLGGGGVDGAIHAAAGPGLLKACRKVPADALGVRCPVGQARLTAGFELPARFVIHTVGPVYARDPDPEGHLAQAYRSCLDLAEHHGLRTIAFPALSCGAYGYPLHEAAEIAVRTVRERPRDLDEVRFVLFTEAAFRAWEDASGREREGPDVGSGGTR